MNVLGDSKYSVQYVNIDSMHKKNNTNIKKIIKLVSNPLAFNNTEFKIFVDTQFFEINDKISLSGLVEQSVQLRSTPGCFLFENNNLTINASIILSPIVTINGFIGDTKTDIIYNTRQYKFNIIKNINTKTIQIFEDVLGSAYLRIVEFTIDLYGTVININTDMLDINNNISWMYNNTIQTIPPNYYIDAQNTISNIVCVVPTTIYKVMQYVNNIQNLIRPLFIQYVNTLDSNFKNLYSNAYKIYPASVQIITDIKKTTITSFIGNIPVNTLNTQHNVSNNSIILIKPYVKTEVEINNYLLSNTMCVSIYEDSKYDVLIKYDCYHNVPIKFINQVHTIKSIEQDYLSFDMDYISNSYDMFGGELYINILEIETLNRYIIDLERSYSNIIMIKMISSYFYNSYKNINNNNNCFYWQSIDNTTINKIILPIKQYTIQELKYEIEKLTNYAFDISISENNINFKYYNIIENVIFTKKILLSKINKKNLDVFYQYPFGEYFNNNSTMDGVCIKIYRPNHNMKVNQKIIIKDSLNYCTIPHTYINGEHKIVNVYIDGYDIIIYNINYDTTLDNKIRGGNNIKIYEPCMFRILFEYSDTFGDILGFSNVNTNYDYIITNQEHHRLEHPPYILICCDSLSITNNLGPIKKYFYKINLCNEHNYDTFVDAPLILQEPLRNINQLKFDIYQPDGKYYDFYDKNYSFVLEFTIYNELPNII